MSNNPRDLTTNSSEAKTIRSTDKYLVVIVVAVQTPIRITNPPFATPMPPLAFPYINSRDTTETVSEDAQMEESGTSTIAPMPASSSRTNDTNQRGASVGSRVRPAPYNDKPSKVKAHAREQIDSIVTIASQAAEIDRLKLQASTNDEMLEVFKKQMEDMRRELDQVKETAADIEHRVRAEVSNSAEAKVLDALHAKQVAEDEVIESNKRAAEALEAKKRAEEAIKESDKRMAEALETKQRAEQQIAETEEKAKKALEAAQNVAEGLIIEKEQQGLKLSELLRQIEEKEEQPRQSEDEEMEDADVETNKQAAAALEAAKRREEMLNNKVCEQAELMASLRRQLQEKAKEREVEMERRGHEDEHMDNDNARPAATIWPIVPKPMQPERPTAGAGPPLAGTRRRPAPPLPPRLRTQTWDDITKGTEFDNDDSSSAAPSLENLDTKLNLLLQKVLPALQHGLNTPHPKRAGKDFKTPVKRTWVRFQINKLIGIQKDEDIKDIEDLILLDSPLNLRMVAFEKDARTATPPDFEPMQPNLNIISGRWNDKLFDYFLDHCRKEYAENIECDEEMELLEIFKDRISSLRKVMRRHRPKEGETMNAAASRARATHLAALARQRRNTRRNETFSIRFDTTNAHVCVQDPGAEWIDNNTVVSLLSCEGMSSDESDVDDFNRKIFKVKTNPWRNPILTAKLQSVDADRNTANVYGNSKGGTPPRMRKRKDGRPSARKPPRGKPINFYDPVWYEGLNVVQKRDLEAKPAVRLMENMDVE